MNKFYTLNNLGCANCAAKIETKISQIPGIESASITFATKQLKITANNPDNFLPEMQKIAASIETDVVITERVQKRTGINLFESVHTDIPDLNIIIIGAVLFAFAIVASSYNSNVSLVLFIFAYLVLGGSIVMTAIKNILKGQVFDENFLMSIATIGAFAIQEYPEAVGVMLFFRVGEYFEEKAVEKSRGHIMDAIDLRPEVVNLVVGSGVKEIPAEDANMGDELIVRPGDRIPLDGYVLEGESRIDTAPITGEPVPVRVFSGEKVVSGCINTSGVLKIKVEKTLEESMVTQILDSVENAAASKPKIDRFITRFARVYTPFVVLLAVLTAILPSIITGHWSYWVYTALTFLVISCPCALVLSVPLAFFSAIGAGSKKGILFKGGLALEAIKKVNAVVMDKTGTITKGEFTVQEIICSSALFSKPLAQIYEVTEPLRYDPLEKTQTGELINTSVERYLLFLAASCEMSSTHPIGVSIVNAAKIQNLNLEMPSSIEEVAGKGIIANLSAGKILCGNRKLLTESGVNINTYTSNLRGSEILLALNDEFIGALIISDTIKPDSLSAISNLKMQGITTAMLTGDSQESADIVATATGIDEVYAKLLPNDKLRILQEIRKAHGAVMFVGDGINDTPVLAGADVSAAMGSGADSAIAAADIVFMTSSLDAVPTSIAIAKMTTRIAMQNVIFALAIKGLVMVLGLLGLASMWMAVFADSGVAMLCVLNSIRILYTNTSSSLR